MSFMYKNKVQINNRNSKTRFKIALLVSSWGIRNKILWIQRVASKPCKSYNLELEI